MRDVVVTGIGIVSCVGQGPDAHLAALKSGAEPRVDGGARPGVEGHDLVHVPGEVEDDSGAGGLPGDGRTAAPGHDGYSVRATDLKHGRHVLGVSRRDDAEGDPPVVGGVHGGQCPGGDVEADVTAHGLAQFRFQTGHGSTFPGRTGGHVSADGRGFHQVSPSR